MNDKLGEAEYRVLARTFLFRGIERSFLIRAAEDPFCRRVRVPKRTAIYRPEAYQRSLGIILSGSAEVSKDGGGGGGMILSILPEGSLFGAAALFNDCEEYATTITALEACDLLFFPQGLVSVLLRENAALAENYIRYLSGRIRFLSGKIDSLAAGSAERRLAHFLLESSKDGRVDLGCSMTGLAARLKVSRASLYRAFEALEEAGSISREGKTVRLLDLSGNCPE